MNDNYSQQHEFYKLVGAAIRKARINTGLTREQIIDKLKELGVTMSSDTFYHKEIGLIRTHDSELFAIAKALDIPIESLFSDE